MASWVEKLSKAYDGFKTHVNDTVSGGFQASYDLATSILDGDDVTDAFRDFSYAFSRSGRDNFGGVLGGAGGMMDSLIDSNALTRNLAEGMEATYHETVGRGLTTAGLAQNIATEGDTGMLDEASEWKNLFDGDTWAKAYEMSDRVSPGQAFAGMGFGMEADQIDAGVKAGEFAEGRMMWASGATDFAARLLDPTVLAGKAAGAARLKYIKPISSVHDARKYTESKRFAAVEKIINTAKSADEIRLRLLNNNSNGAAVAQAWWATRHDPEMLRITTRALYGDQDALADLRDYNTTLAKLQDPKLAGSTEALEILSRVQAGQGRLTRRSRIGTSLEEFGDWETYVAQLGATDQLFSQRVTMSDDLLAQVAEMPLASTNKKLPLAAPRDTYSSRMRFALHQGSYYGSAPILVRNFPNVMLPSNRRIHSINLTDTNSDQAVRTYLERSGMPEELKTKHLNSYIAASGNQTSRLSAMVRAEEEVIRHMGRTYGYTESQVNEIITTATRGRGRAREILARKHEFMSEDVQKKLVDQGTVTTWTDDAGGIHAVPIPVFTTQLGDLFPVADPQALHSAMKNAASRGVEQAEDALYKPWDQGSGVRNALSATSGEVSRFTDFVHRLWKPTVLVGLGYPIRFLSDEGGRQIAVYGLGDVAMSTGRGFMNSPLDAVERGKTAWYAMRKERNRGLMRDLRERTIRKDETPPTERWTDLAHAYSRGAISRGDFTAIAREAGKAGLGDMFTAARVADEDWGSLTKGEFERALVETALEREGKDWFVRPNNHRDLLSEVNESGMVEINPMTGEATKIAKDAREFARTVIKPHPVRGDAEASSPIYDFIYDNSDDFLRDGAGMRAMRREDGALELIAYRPFKSHKERRADLKGFKKEFVNRARSAGNSRFTVNPAPGVTWEVDGAFMGSGEAMRKAASSDPVHVNYMMERHGTIADRIAVSSGWTPAMNPDNVEYPAAYERAVALQIGGDPAARDYLAHGSYELLKDWATREPAGQKWARDMAMTGDLDDRLQRVVTQVDSYVPDAMREKVLAGTATYDDLVKAIPNASERPQVHAELLDYNLNGGPAAALARKATHKMFDKLATMPSDKASRFPFYDKSYRAHMAGLAKIEFENNKSATISAARREELQEIARKKALADVRKWLYNSDMTSDGIAMIRHFAPFGNAWQDGARAWGKLALTKPQVPAIIYQIWKAPERAGLIVDREGRQLTREDGKEVWYEVHPVTGERVKAKGPADESRYIQFQLPTWMTPDEFGEDVTVPLSINKDSFNTFVHLDPGAGPIVQVGMSEFLKRDIGINMSESNFAKRLLPYGPSESIVKPMLSNELRGVYENFRGEEDSVFRNQAMMILQAEIVKYNRGDRVTKPSFEEAADKANDLKWLRIALTSTLPVSPNFKSPFQAHIDAYRQLKAADFSTADEKFLEQYGEDYFVLTAKVTEGVGGLPPSMPGYKQFTKYRDLIEKYPDIAGVIMGSTGGSFNKSVYEFYKSEQLRPGSSRRLRELMDMEDALTDVHTRLAWEKFTSMMDVIDADMLERGLADIRDEGAEDLLEQREAFVEKFGYNADGTTTGWFKEYMTRDPSKMINKLAGLRAVATDPKMLGREDIQGVAEYLKMRDDFKAELAERDEFGGAKTLEAKDNEDLAILWREGVASLKDQNLGFAEIYNRYLMNDDLEV